MSVNVTIEDGRILGYKSSSELASENDIDYRLISQWANRGKIEPAFRIGKKYYFDENVVLPGKWTDRRRK